MTDHLPPPFALSLSKGGMHAQYARSWFDAPQEIPQGDKLTTNGRCGVSHFTNLNKPHQPIFQTES